MFRPTPFGLPFLLILLAVCPAIAGESEGRKRGTWWEAETALSAEGRLDLSGKPWWKRAQSLRLDQHFALKSDRPGGGWMLVRRERLERKWPNRPSTFVEAIVWSLDDDGDFRPDDTTGDKDSDCYAVDYGGDGQVDRMVDYMDNDRDGKADAVDIRYFAKGQLRIGWFGLDLDKDGRLWDLAAYEYSGDFFRSDPYGDNLVFANRYDPERREWLPIGECPFAFLDTDHDGESEVVVRVSVAPLDFDPRTEPDPGNALFKPGMPFQPRFRRPGAVNVRYSLDLDGLAGPPGQSSWVSGGSPEPRRRIAETSTPKADEAGVSLHPTPLYGLPPGHERWGGVPRRLHYDLGFNLIGRVPYPEKGTAQPNTLRREPKTVRTIAHADAQRFAETYPAEATGFSWHEHGDDGVALGAGPHPEEDRRWEGVFWTWERRFMHNTGGPTQTWNVRREYRPTPSTKRELYYCMADRRIHLLGATDGWIRVGHLGDPKSVLGEVRMFDTDRDGHFDRWETYRPGESLPAWVGAVSNPGVRKLPTDWDELERLYTRRLLPEALAANEQLMAAMRRVDKDFQTPDELAKALKAASCDGERRYVQDVIRHGQYLALREKLARRVVAAVENGDAPRFPPGRLTDATADGWSLAETLALLDTAYAEGRYADAAKLLGRIEGRL